MRLRGCNRAYCVIQRAKEDKALLSQDSFWKALAESFAKPSTIRTTISNAKFEVEKFDGTNSFGM